MRSAAKTSDGKSAFESLCLKLEILGRALGIRPGKRRNSALNEHLELSGLWLSSDTVAIASRTGAVLAALSCVCLSPVVVAMAGLTWILPLGFASLVSPYLVKEAIASHPADLARKKALEVLRDSNEAINLMMMSLRHDPSLPKAIGFASRRRSAFSRELRRCVWGVIMGKFSSFDEAVHAFSAKWSRFAHELKTSMNALVTASCEATQEGKRRALDRANQAMISGAKRRIEEYALSLSTPSMLLFGLGILLPLMVGSFLPMLSWNLWTTEGLASDGLNHSARSEVIRSAFLMNILFPGIAAAVVINAVSKHPVRRRKACSEEGHERRAPEVLVVVVLTAALVIFSLAALEDVEEALAVLMSCTVPVALWLIAKGAAQQPSSAQAGSRGLEDMLFRTGGYMVEGENFESSFWKAASDMSGAAPALALKIRMQSNPDPLSLDERGPLEKQAVEDNAILGLRIAHEAAKKDERAAGLLAMDLAAYLRDLRDLEATLRNRLRPTITMMKITAHVLAPIVLGVTYAIYLSLGSIVEGSVSVSPADFFLVLGGFLAEMNVIVLCFVNGIDGRAVTGSLMYSIGTCLLASELIYSATAILTS